MPSDITWPAERVTELLATIKLTTGHHANGTEACAMDLIGMAVQGEWTDTPTCVHPILARAVHRINDHPDTTPADRLALVTDAGPLLIGTNDKTRTPWAVIVAYRAGLTTAGLIASLATTPPRADLSGVNLYGADLSGVNLSGVNLYGADLSGADLSGADLYGVNLYGVNLSGVNLSGADLSGADRLDKALNVPADVLAAWKAARNG